MPWEDRDVVGQGGGIEYEFAIHSSKAGFTEYNEGKTCLLILEGEKTFTNGRVMDDHMWVSAPNGWSCTEDGTSFIKDDNPNLRFEKRSKIQTFINSAIKAGVPLQERTENSLDTTGWAGLKLRIREEERSFKAKDTGEEVTYNQPLVIEYLGEVSGSSSPSSSKRATKISDSNGSDDELIAKARAIAAQEPDLVSHMDRVTRELGVPLDHPVCSKSFYESAK